MTQQAHAADAPPEPVGWYSHVLSCALAVASFFYLMLFWIRPQPWMPACVRSFGSDLRLFIGRQLNAGLHATVGSAPSPRWMWALVSLIMALIVPWLIMMLIGRGRPRDLGIRKPNRIGWRLMIVGYLAALPLLALMASYPETRFYYRRELSSLAAATVFGPYLLVLIAEHFLFHGVLLALLRPCRRWPAVDETAPTEGGFWLRLLRWIGLAQPVGDARGICALTRWIGLPQACGLALILQSVLFGLVHLGKAPAELAMSFPAGVALGYVAYRCNSWFVPMFLHAATGLTVLAMIWLWPA